MFTEKDLYTAESLILQHPWKSEKDFYDFIGKGGTYYKVQEYSLLSESKELFFCRIELIEGSLQITARFLGGDCDIILEVLEYSPETIVLKRVDSEEALKYAKYENAGPHSPDADFVKESMDF